MIEWFHGRLSCPTSDPPLTIKFYEHSLIEIVVAEYSILNTKTNPTIAIVLWVFYLGFRRLERGNGVLPPNPSHSQLAIVCLYFITL